ncbi:MAG: DUF4974 domain-containing protein [Bacteroidales bacterium]|nr:DUF4974 domain-containing protein [Bacteroidales bacterium]
MKERETIDIIITDYLQGNCQPDLVGRLKAWVAKSSVNERYFLRRQEAWFDQLSRAADAPFDKAKAFSLFRARVADTHAAQQEAKLEAPTRHYRWIGYAAAVVLVCCISYFCYWEGAQNVKQQFADVVVEAPEGSRTKLYLPDGTLVWLNAGSRMCYSQGFGMEQRAVLLEGEGYFDVKRNDRLPFYVYTNELRLKVLGTKFNFRDYPKDDVVTVTLIEGKVSLTNLLRDEDEIFLSPNERAILSKKTGEMKVESMVAANTMQWTNGYLFFDERPLSDIIIELERSYNVSIRVERPEVRSMRFYGNFDRQKQGIHEILQALSATGKIKYKFEGRTIVIY